MCGAALAAATLAAVTKAKRPHDNPDEDTPPNTKARKLHPQSTAAATSSTPATGPCTADEHVCCEDTAKGCSACHRTCHTDCSDHRCSFDPCESCLSLDVATPFDSELCKGIQRDSGCHACERKHCWSSSPQCRAPQPASSLPLPLYNSGNNFCYLNALLQSLAHVPLFRDWAMAHYATGHDEPLEQECHLCSLGRDLKAIFEGREQRPYRPTLVQTRAVWSSDWRGLAFEGIRQQDVDDAWMKLSDKLKTAEEAALSPGLPGEYHKLLATAYGAQLTCSSCQGKGRHQDIEMFSLQLALPATKAKVEDLLHREFGKQHVEEGTLCPELCKAAHPQLQKFHTVTQWPPVLVLTLKRFSGGLQKITTAMEHTERLLLDGTHHYLLWGVIVHGGGTIDAGHYTAYVRREGALWLLCDDEQTPKIVPLADVLAAEAYMLLYQRDNIAYEDAPEGDVL